MSGIVTESALHNPHDLGYKYLLSNKYLFIELLQSFVVKDWTGLLEEDTVGLASNSFVTHHFKSKFADLVYQVQLNQQDHYFYLLTELQSTVDFTIPFRLLSYIMDAWSTLISNTPEHEKSAKGFCFPVIVPLVLYNGKNNWTAVREFKEKLAGYENFDQELVNFTYHLIDVNRYSREELKNMSNTIGAIFLLEQNYDIIELPGRLLDAMAMLKDKTSQPTFQTFRRWVEGNFIPRLPQELREDFLTMLRELSSREVDSMQTNLGNKVEEYLKWREQIGFDKGIAEGLEKGLEKGKIEIATKMLKENLSIHAIAKMTNLSLSEILQLSKEIYSE